MRHASLCLPKQPFWMRELESISHTMGELRGSARSYPFAVEARANGQEILGSDLKKVVLT